MFAGEGASNECGVVVNGDFRFFRSLYLPNLHIHGHNYYIVLCSLLVALHWHRNKWPSMTLNGHFCIKIWSELGIQWVNGVMAFGENCSKICRATHRLSAAKNVAQLVLYVKCTTSLYWWYKSHGVIHWNNRTGSVKPVNCIYSFTLTFLTHAVHWCL